MKSIHSGRLLVADQVLLTVAAALRHPLTAAQVMQRMSQLGAVIVPGSKHTSEGLKTWLAEETARYAPVIKAAGQFAD